MSLSRRSTVDSMRPAGRSAKVHPEQLIVVVLCVAATIAIALNNVVIGYKAFGISYDRLAEFGIFLILAPLLGSATLRHEIGNALIWIFIAFVLLKTLMLFGDTVRFSGLTLEYLMRHEVRLLTFFVFGTLFYFSLFHFRNTLNLYLILVFPAFALAFFEHSSTPFTEFALALKQDWFVANMPAATLLEYEEYFETGFVPRPSGPYGFAITLSYAAFASLAVSGYMILTKKKGIYELLFFFFALVGAMTLTRSLVLGMAPMVAYLALQRKRMFLLCTVGAVIYMTLAAPLPEQGYGFSRFLKNDPAANADRKAAFTAAVRVVADNPFYSTDADYNAEVSRVCAEMGGCGKEHSPHNGLINIAREYSLPGLILFLVVIRLLWKASQRLSKLKRRYFLCVGIGYVAHVSFHNNIVLLSDYAIVVPLALFLFEVKLSSTEATRHAVGVAV